MYTSTSNFQFRGCWSFGTSKRSFQINGNAPGPGAYSAHFLPKRNAPHYRIGTGQRNQVSKILNPGPGTYESNEVVGNSKIKRASKYSFGLKLPLQGSKQNFPGAGAYDPRILNTQEQNAPRFSFGLKTASSFSTNYKNPGPGQYEFKSTVIKVPSSIIGRSKRMGLADNNNNPSPVTYQSVDFKSMAPKFGFGTGQRQFNDRVMTPGPGNYQVGSSLDLSSKKGKTMGIKLQDVLVDPKNKNPGPGQYNPLRLSGKQNIRIGRSLRQSLARNVNIPGPGTYQNQTIFVDRPRTPSYGVGTSKRRPLSASCTTPGPGTYQIPEKIVEGPQYNFRLRTPLLLGYKGQPGPGTYNPSQNLVLEKSAMSVFGHQNRNADIDKDKLPGPGTYEMRLKNFQGPKYGFGTSIRSANSSRRAPGPGQYDIENTIGRVPRYLNTSPSMGTSNSMTKL